MEELPDRMFSSRDLLDSAGGKQASRKHDQTLSEILMAETIKSTQWIEDSHKATEQESASNQS